MKCIAFFNRNAGSSGIKRSTWILVSNLSVEALIYNWMENYNFVTNITIILLITCYLLFFWLTFL